MRSFEVFAAMPPDEAESFFSRIKKASPTIFAQAVHAAGATLKMRPAYLGKQPFPKQASAVKRALSRVAANPLADETLAMYFLEVRKELLTEWLDAVGLEHEDGTLLVDEPPEPDESTLAAAVDKFRSADEDPDRRLLLQAFAAQSAIDWPTLEARLQ